LAEDNHRVHESRNGREALAYYEQHWREIDLVILDMVMPEMNGHDTFREMKKINPGIKALLATGFSMNSEVQAILDDGVLGFIQKPFDPKQLRATIAKAMG
jgi:DNA-binding NtrC family response regulator